MKARALIALLALGAASGALARADVVAVVAAQSRIVALSKAQLSDVFLGKLARLPDGTSVVPLDHAEGSVLRDEFYNRVTGKSPGQMKAYWSKLIFTGRGRPPRALPNSAEVLRALHANPSAISYLDRTQIDSSVRVLN